MKVTVWERQVGAWRMRVDRVDVRAFPDRSPLWFWYFGHAQIDSIDFASGRGESEEAARTQAESELARWLAPR